MIKKRYILLVILFVILINFASAKFICGEVKQTDNMNPSWHDVKAYPKGASYFSNCVVSPANNKYCCDIDLLKDHFGYTWKPSDSFVLEITDLNSGYFASRKEMQVTGEGYDIAPNLILTKAIKMTYPENKLVISPSQIDAIIEISDECISENESNKILLEFGKNILTPSAICNDKNFSLIESIFLLEGANLEKKYSNFSHNNEKVRIKSEEIGKINIEINLSHEVEEIILKEYVPSSWEILDVSNNGTVEFSTQEYSVIIWSISGLVIDLSYELKSPSVGVIPRDYLFKTQIENYDLLEQSVEVYRFLPRVIRRGRASVPIFEYNLENLSKVSSELPLIYEQENTIAAFYSTTPKEDAAFDFTEFLYDGFYNRSFDYIKSYLVRTNMNSTEAGNMKFQYKINKSMLQEKDYEDISFMGRRLGQFFTLTGRVIKSDDSTITYQFESPEPLSEFFIFAKKSRLDIWDRLIIFAEKIFLFLKHKS